MFIVGELINGMYKNVRQALETKDKKIIQDIAKKQTEAGASALDVNCGPASRNPKDDIKWMVEAIQEVVDTPLCMDSTKTDVIEAGLSTAKNKTIINSTGADKEKLDILVPMALKYKSSLIGLAMNKKGVPQDKFQRLELAATIVTYCQENNFPVSNLYLDPIVLPVNVAQAQAQEVLGALHEFKLLSDPAPKTIVGLSNVSQGAPDRSLINRTFLVMAQCAGLDGAILDPLDKNLMDALITAELILNKQIYCDSFLDAYKKK
ncbi:MAG: methyltetrahydrofolate--corrinoid methyltransferase [Candidatus Omnitrophica bacterium CG11_big_fil_rev_8_21_14_0_20_42_13]|uniref:Methyltetrahydrofolate--corrinoid methyltransferase n=1 Tax=Candidatus Ghiorseimicrobium undicola TaxID=1974746 RepID=A0A2H0M034_9BACT|nr:MAG: methyltetrahydrofolate--corrinoid methyltransferase [Candidatus Omnitrophica bacterium CG11_big_fil_rev_8_21_14_0_20_42_13]